MHVHTLEPVKQSTNGSGEASAQPVLELSHITAGYWEARAIEDVTATIRHGKRVALIGPNGAGKSTLFRTIVGLLTPTKGHVLIHGSPNAQARQHAAYVPQFEDVDWDFPVSVLDVVVM